VTKRQLEALFREFTHLPDSDWVTVVLPGCGPVFKSRAFFGVSPWQTIVSIHLQIGFPNNAWPDGP
jgi:hypothetical protein